MCRALDLMRNPTGIIRSEFDHFVEQHQAALIETDIVHPYNDGPAEKPSGFFLNISRLQELHNGAIWQLATKIERLTGRINELEANYGI